MSVKKFWIATSITYAAFALVVVIGEWSISPIFIWNWPPTFRYIFACFVVWFDLMLFDAWIKGREGEQ